MGSETTGKLKAYQIGCIDDDHGARVVFAKRGRDVDKQFSTDNCDCEFIDRHVRRAPKFDKYAPGPMTTDNYIEEGWWWSCSGICHAEHLTKEDSPLVEGDCVFCSLECAAKMLTEIEFKGYTDISWKRLKAAIEKLLKRHKYEPTVS